MSALPALPAPESPEAAPFWAALADDRLLLPVCDGCGHHIWYPRAWCPVCGGESVTWCELTGRGTVYACTVVRKSMGPWMAAAPYVAAYVELAEGPRILTNIVTDDVMNVKVGTGVEAVFVPVADPPEGSPAQKLLRFAVRAVPR